MFCAECKYYVGYVGSDRGDCVRHAPVVNLGVIEYATLSKADYVDAMTERTVFPVVFGEGFCGDYEKESAE